LLAFLAIFAIQLSFFGFIALHRFVDGDEGYYLLASRLVLMHKTPYLDFFYQQAPLLPYVYAAWMKIAGVTWVSAKLFSAVLTALLGTLLGEQIYHQTKNWISSAAALVLFAFSTRIFAWLPIAKTFSLAGLFLFAAYVVVSRFSERPSKPWVIFCGGILFGLSFGVRSYLILLGPLLLWWLYVNCPHGIRREAAAWFLLGICAASALPLYLFVKAPGLFLFNNLGYHAIRSDSGLVGEWGQKFLVLLMSFLGGPQGNGIQTSLLFILSLGFVFSIRKRAYSAKLAFILAVGTGLISLLPTPVLGQYFSLCAPFLLVSATCVAWELYAELDPGKPRIAVGLLYLVLAGVYVGFSFNDFHNYLVTGDGVWGVQAAADKDDWRLGGILSVSRAVDQIALPGETVASFWPGHIFQTKVKPYPGLENDFALPIAHKLTPEEAAKYHVLSLPALRADLAAHRIRIFVLRNEGHSGANGDIAREIRELEDTVRSYLVASGYTVARSIGGTSIYVWDWQ
jgi:hypothetical protein